MGKIVISENVTLDGVIQDPTGDDGFARGGWFNRIAGEDHQAWAEVESREAMDAEALLLGRRTYEYLVARWPGRTGAWADRLNSMPKYVASRSLQEPLAWNATVLKGDLAESVPALKDRHDRTLAAVGAGELTHALTTLGLVDEFWFWVSPSLWPAGPRIFDGVGPVRLELIGSTTFGSGVVRLAYRPAPDG